VVKLSPHHYRTLRRSVWMRQGMGCGKCFRGLALEQMELHHESRVGFAGKISHGRGLGGGKRDDSRTIGLCVWCHRGEEERKRREKDA
jgi:hypothetical protein